MGCYAKMTKVELEKIGDPDKYMFFEQRMRGGVSYIKKRYSKASKIVNILYLDMNNLFINIYLLVILSRLTLYGPGF